MSNLNGNESLVIGSILEKGGQDLPPYCARLLNSAPESFDDLRLNFCKIQGCDSIAEVLQTAINRTLINPM